MPPKLPRPIRLRRDAADEFARANCFPAKSHLLEFLRDAEAEGTEGSVHLELKECKPVTESVAIAFTNYLLDFPIAVPPALSERLTGTTVDTAVALLFEPLPKGYVYKSYNQPDSSSDPTGKGIVGVVAAVFDTIFNLTGRVNAVHAPARYFDGVNGLNDFERLCYIEAGFGNLPKGTRVTVEEAEQRGHDWGKCAPGYFADYSRRLMSINRDFVRYALTPDGDRVGMSAAFAITDAAYRDCLEGRKGMDDFEDDDIVPNGNNQVLFMLTEDHERPEHIRQATARNAIVGSMLLQIALIARPEVRRPIRCISYGILGSNTKRLKAVWFEETPHYFDCSDVGFPSYTTMYFDPMQHGIIRRNMMLVLDDLVWRIRSSVDELAEEDKS
ncbi:MAG: hypothetical protein Aurels2KO_54930 [Aureliella sp.]